MYELELVSHAAYRSFYGPAAIEVAGATCFRLPEAPDSPMLNRVVGLGLHEPATEEQIDEALETMGDATFYVAVSPFAAPSDLALRLDARGLEHGWGWMVFERDASPPPHVTTELRLTEVEPGAAHDWAYVVNAAYGLPEALIDLLETVPGTPGWTCWLALEGDTPAAAAGLWVEGETGYLGFAGTLAEHRGKAGQGALLAARIERARELGCTTLVTETGEQLPDRPSNSYRNILRFGFREQFVTAHRLRRRAS